jgi:hypothetical protein
MTARQPIGVPHADTVPQPGAIGDEECRPSNAPPSSLPPGHRCQVDDLAYESVSAWFHDHHGRVPIQAAAGLDRYIKATGSAFAGAFTALSGKGGPIILIEQA